jgi:hypothetical protein
MGVPRILIPIAIDNAMFGSSTVAEPAAGETAWVSAGSYTAGDIRIRTGTHRKYMALTTHSGVTTAPEDDPIRWKDVGATQRWAMFDPRRTTQTTATTTLTIVLNPGWFNALDLFLLSGSEVSVTVKDAPGGTVIFTETRSIVGPFLDEWDYCFGPWRNTPNQLFTDIPISASAELTLTISGDTGEAVGCGMLCIGDLRPLIIGDWGGAEYGAAAEPISCSYIKTDDFGDTQIVKRASATNATLSIVLPQVSADYALACIQEVLDIPAAIVGTEISGYSGLNVFGLLSGAVTYAGPNHATIRAQVKGLF